MSSISEQDELDEALDARNWELVVVDEFRRFVRPTWRPKLSAYCTQLTGITQVGCSSLFVTRWTKTDQSAEQADVDQAGTFVQVLQEFKQLFIKPYKLFTKRNKTAWVTDGPWVSFCHCETR